VLRDESDDALDRRDSVLFLVARWVAALVKNGPQLLCPLSGCLKRPRWSFADSDEMLTVVKAIDEDE
jgi:hypothetical protein